MQEEEKKEKLSEEEIGRRIAAGRKRKYAADMERKRYHQRRSILRRELALRKGITYRFLRPLKFRMVCKDGEAHNVQPAKGGVVVAYRAQTLNQMSVAVSICLPNDVFDKIEGKRRAFERLLPPPMTDGTEDGLGVMHVSLSGRGEFRDPIFVRSVLRLSVRNAVANLRKASDRQWFSKHILPQFTY